MSASGDSQKIAVSAGADLSAAQYKVIDVAGTISAANSAALGVLQNKPKSGEDASVAVLGHMKAYAGGTITKGARLKVTTSGWLVVVASGDGTCGKSLQAANSGSLVEFIGDFISASTTY
jgi:Uncharacterized conserved protein (DUF2190)